MENLTPLRIVTDGIIYGSIASIAIILSLRWNPRLWIQDFPEAIREKMAPLDATEKRHRAIFGVIFMALIFGLPLVLLGQLQAELSFGEIYLYMFGLLLAFNLFDAVLVDLLFITILRPDFLRIPGTEDMAAMLHDPRMHIIPFLKGMVFCVIGAGVLALPAAFVL